MGSFHVSKPEQWHGIDTDVDESVKLIQSLRSPWEEKLDLVTVSKD